MHNPQKGPYTQVDRSLFCAIMEYVTYKVDIRSMCRHRCILVMARIHHCCLYSAG